MNSQERTTSTSRVAHAAVARAVDSLLKWLRRREDDDSLYLVMTLNKVPHPGRPASILRVLLPHLFHSSVCLLVDDRPKSALAPSAAAALVRDLALPVALVLPLSELRSLCRSPEARQSLADSHDFFLADCRVAPVLPSVLGTPFFPRKKKKGGSKTPVPLDLALPSWPEEVRRVCGSTVLHLGPGTCSVIKVGRAAQGRAEVIDNVMAAIEGAVSHVPKKWKNVRSLHLKANDSLALPIYNACADVAASLKRKGEVEEGEEDGNGEESGSDEPGEESGMKVENVSKKHKINYDNTKNNDAKAIKRRKVKHGIS